MTAAITALAPITVTPPAAAPALGATPSAGGLSFSQMLGNVMGASVDTLARAESTSITALQGKASLQQVVDSITAAEQTLQTVLTVRDKAVSAWQDISRMTI